MQGFHVGGSKYMTIRTDDRSVYGKKVRPFSPFPIHNPPPLPNPTFWENEKSEASVRLAGLLILGTGQRRRHLRENKTSDPHRPLPRARATGDRDNGC